MVALPVCSGPVTTAFMFTTLIAVIVVPAACAFLGGWFLGKFLVRARLGDIVVASEHRRQLQALHRRYRRRLRAARDALVQQKANREQLRNALREAENRREVKATLLAAAEREVQASRQRIATLELQQQESERLIATLQEQTKALQTQLAEAQEKFAATEREHGLLRIERDELAARTQRLQALPRDLTSAPDDHSQAAAQPPDEDVRAQIGMLRHSLAERDSRIHELECQLREGESRRRELESNLHSWKLRIAPLAYQLKKQRERTRRFLASEQPAQASSDKALPADPPTAPDTSVRFS